LFPPKAFFPKGRGGWKKFSTYDPTGKVGRGSGDDGSDEDYTGKKLKKKGGDDVVSSVSADAYSASYESCTLHRVPNMDLKFVSRRVTPGVNNWLLLLLVW